MADALLSAWPGVPRAEAQSILLSLIGMAGQLEYWSADELGRLVSESEDLDVPADDQPAFAALVAAVVEAPVVKTTAKAFSVLLRQEHVFQEARILTDIRPIFGSDPDETPDGAVVINTLSIEHRTEGRTHTFNVALDTNDLADLAAVVERAKAKSRVLADIVKSTNLRLFEVEDFHGDA